jgi:hypothetical protein
MDRYLFHDAKPPLKTGETRHPGDDVLRRLASSSSEQSRHDKLEKNIKTFISTFNTTIEKRGDGSFLLRSIINGKEGKYINSYNIDKGKIRGESNYKKDIENWYLSDVVYHQLQLATQKAGKSISDFDLKSWYGSQIKNPETKETAERLLRGAMQQTFYAGSNDFTALAQTPTAKSKFYLLKDYPESFPGKRVTSITVIRHDYDQMSIEYEFGS